MSILAQPGNAHKSGAQTVSRKKGLQNVVDLPKRELKDPFIRSLKPAAKGQRYGVADTLVQGLKVRVSDTGSKTYIVWKRWNGAKNPSARTLGKVGEITLADARTKAREWLEMRARGVDPKGRKPAGDTFGAVMEEYLARHVSSQRRAVQTTQEIRRELLPRWKDRPLNAITRAEVVGMLDELNDRGFRRQPHNIFGHLRAFFNWAIDRGVYGIEVSPCDRVIASRMVGPKRHRHRVLNDDELAALWRAADGLSYPWGPFYKLALLTGARRSEVAEARWSEFDLVAGVWTVPPERFKSGMTHVVPLSADAIALVRGLPRHEGGEFVFSATKGQTAISNLGRPKALLDQNMRDELGTLEPYVLHDLRRTVRTRLSALRVPEPVAERIIGHGAKGLQRVYDQHRYLDEMREGLEAWAARLRLIISVAEGGMEGAAKIAQR